MMKILLISDHTISVVKRLSYTSHLHDHTFTLFHVYRCANVANALYRTLKPLIITFSHPSIFTGAFTWEGALLLL